MSQTLEVGATDLKCKVNNTAHNADEFGFERLVLRRGSRFTITVNFMSRGYQPNDDNISFIVQTGLEASGAFEKITFPLSNSLAENSWNAALVSNVRNQLTVSICSPSTSKIGHFSLNMVCSTKGQSRMFNLGEFILLFNPWCSADAVFLDAEDKRREYVLNDQGLTYYGTHKDIKSSAWNFGQFEHGIVDICLKLLNNSKNYDQNPKEDFSKRNDPIYISRIITAVVNCNDDNGILKGKWDGEYSDGISPSQWNGSISILHRWNESGCQPVRYGQCWVFAALACTVLRCFGIPTRHITNFNSAHDKEQDLKIDSFSDERGKTLNISKDSIWNFHCWVESWMTRPDLKPGYDGWQVLDPTPQERSGGVFCCGPSPLKAIKNGDVDLKFDTPFVFAEVNADCVSWLVYKDGSKRQISVNHQLVGQHVSTKAVGRNEREDITHNYKYAEDSKKERDTFNKADAKVNLPTMLDNPMTIKLNASQANQNGKNFETSVVVTNNTSAVKTGGLFLCAQTIFYNGKPIQECGWKNVENFNLGPQEVKTETFQVRYSDYSKSITEHNQICITSLVVVYDTNEVLVAKKVITLQNPELDIKIIGEPEQYREMVAEICFTNPLPEDLCNGVFHVEGAGLTDEQVFQCPIKSIRPGTEVKVRAKFTPQKSGLRKLIVDFDCNKLKDLKGSKNVIIKPSN
ncbi:protein-glutamine gamma-glutamyltransferase 2-like [Rhinoraja longicauda]